MANRAGSGANLGILGIFNSLLGLFSNPQGSYPFSAGSAISSIVGQLRRVLGMAGGGRGLNSGGSSILYVPDNCYWKSDYYWNPNTKTVDQYYYRFCPPEMDDVTDTQSYGPLVRYERVWDPVNGEYTVHTYSVDPPGVRHYF